jgi:hypothetical protein
MSDKRSFILAHPEARRRAMACVADAPAGYAVEVREPTKKRIQEERYHAMIGDIAKQMEHIGRKWDADDMKRLLIDEFADQMRAAGTPLHHDGRVVPSLDGRRIVQLGIQSSDFYVKEASQFIEFLFALGAERGIRWTDPTLYRAEVPA